MPRYFFHIHDDLVTRDEEGKVLPSIEYAHEEARRGAIDLACAELQKGKLNLNHRIEIADGGGSVLGVVSFRETVEIED